MAVHPASHPPTRSTLPQYVQTGAKSSQAHIRLTSAAVRSHPRRGHAPGAIGCPGALRVFLSGEIGRERDILQGSVFPTGSQVLGVRAGSAGGEWGECAPELASRRARLRTQRGCVKKSRLHTAVPTRCAIRHQVSSVFGHTPRPRSAKGPAASSARAALHDDADDELTRPPYPPAGPVRAGGEQCARMDRPC